MANAITDVLADIDAKIAFYEQENKVHSRVAKKARNRMRLWKVARDAVADN